VVRQLGPAEATKDDVRPLIRTCLDPGHAAAQIERGSIRATVNGTPVRPDACAQNCCEFTPPQLPNGRHRACVSFRNTLGNSARHCADISVELPPHSIALSSSFAVIPPDPAASTCIDVLVLDRLGRPVIDGTPVTIATSAGRLLQADTATVNGRVRAMLAADAGPGTAMLSASAGSARGHMQVSFAVPAAALLSIAVRDITGQPVSGAALMDNEHIVGRSDSHGSIQLETNAGQHDVQLVKPGYVPQQLTVRPAAGAMTRAEAVLKPIDGGVFLNRTIMLDPEGESPAALPVLKMLKSKIEHAGGRAVFTWQSPPAPSYQARVMQASREGADVFLCVSAESRHCRAGHYHRSEAGRSLAVHLRETLPVSGLFSSRKCAVRHSTHYAIIQTAMPAIELELPRKLAQNNLEGAAQTMYAALRQWLQERKPQAP